jgi:hypothetical protein
MSVKHFFFLGIIIFANTQLYAQINSTQLWTDFTVNKALQNSYSFDCEASYRTNLNSSDKWHSVNITPKIEKSLGNHWDLLLYFGSINTLQQQNYNTWEIRPGLGVRFHFTPVRKLLIRILGRFELRNQYTFETRTWDVNFRSRFRLEETFFINGESFEKNDLWYILSDLELFYTVDKELEERYSDRMLLRLGVGYKLSDSWRFESIYTYQFSKNTITGEFSKDDDGIIRLRFRYTIN